MRRACPPTHLHPFLFVSLALAVLCATRPASGQELAINPATWPSAKLWACRTTHSFAMYALNEEVVLQGTVTRFRWVNPHSVLSVRPDSETDQNPAIWNIELSSPGNLTRTGWSRRSVNVDDQVAVTLHPLRSDDPGGSCMSVTLLATGQVLECGAGEAIRAGERPNLP